MKYDRLCNFTPRAALDDVARVEWDAIGPDPERLADFCRASELPDVPPLLKCRP